MRILHIHSHYREQGGEDVVVSAERALLRSAGHQVTVIDRKNAASGVGAAVQMAKYVWSPTADSEILDAAKQARADVVHIHNTWFSISPSLLPALRERLKLPVVVTVHNFRLSCINSLLLRNGLPCEKCIGQSPIAGVRYRCFRNSTAGSLMAAASIQSHRKMGSWIKGTNRFLALTAFSRQKLISAGLPAERISMSPNFVDDPGPRLKPPSRSNLVTFVGRLSSEKGLSDALKAWRLANPSGLRLMVIGEGPQRSELESLGTASVTFLGRRSRAEIDEILLGSRALVAPSIAFENQPRSVLEAFAAEVPVLASAMGGLGETVQPLGALWNVRPRDIEAWSHAFRKLENNEYVDEGGRRARQQFELKHSPANACSHLEQIYRTVSAES